MGKKISELTLPSLPLAGTELIEMSQAGTSVKITAGELQTDVLGGIGSFDGTTFTVVGDIVCSDLTTSGDTIYLGETPIKEVSENEIQIGDPELNSREAILHLRGDDSDRGGRMRLYLGAAENSTITYYEFYQSGQNLRIGPNTDITAIQYSPGSVGVLPRSLRIGAGQGAAVAADVVVEIGNNTTSVLRGEGTLKVHGAGAGSLIGGMVQVYTASDYDTGIDYYQMAAYEDDLYIGSVNDPDSFKLDGNDNSWNFTHGDLNVGVDNNTKGELSVYGDQASQGGETRLYTGAAYDTTIDYYRFAAGNGDSDLTIGPITDEDALVYNATLNRWQAAATGGFSIGDPTTGSGSNLYIGVDDVGSNGSLRIHGGNSQPGGTIYLHTGEPYDTTIDYYRIQPDEDSLNIGPATNTDALRYDGTLNRWQASATGGFSIGDPTTASGSSLYVGVDDVGQNARVHIYGGNSQPGGSLYLYTGEPYDTTIDHYLFATNEDDLEIGPVTDEDALKYDGSLSQWQFSASGGTTMDGVFRTDSTGIVVVGSVRADDLIVNGDTIYLGGTTLTEAPGGGLEVDGSPVGGSDFTGGQVSVGVDDSVRGTLTLYGDNGESHGRALFYKGADYDDTIEYYRVEAGNFGFSMGPDSGANHMSYLDASGSWDFLGGNVNVGIDDVTKGLVNIYGSAEEFGGELRFYNPADYDSTNEYWNFDLVEDEFSLNTSGGKTLATFYGGGSMELGTAAGQIDIFGNIVLVSPQKIELNAQTKILYKRPSSDLTGSGEVISTTVDQNTRGIAGCLTMGTDGNWDDADSTALVSVGFLGMAVEVGTGTKDVMLKGFMQDDSWSWTPSDKLYVGSFGEITNIEPGSGEYRQVVGYAFSSTEIYFNPSMDYTLVA